MKMRHKHWRNRAYRLLANSDDAMTANEILAQTKTKYSPASASHAAQLLRVDKRFFCYPAPASMRRGGDGQVMLYEVYPDDE